MSKASRCFAIDVGTRNSTIYTYDTRNGRPCAVKVGADEIFPSSYLELSRDKYLWGQEAEDQIQKEPGHAAQLVKGFKIEYWVPDANWKRAAHRLEEFLKLLRRHILEHYEDAENAHYCFTYPAQRTDAQEHFQGVVRKAGFPPERLHFLDECSAAVFGLSWEAPKTAKGDVGGQIS